MRTIEENSGEMRGAEIVAGVVGDFTKNLGYAAPRVGNAQVGKNDVVPVRHEVGLQRNMAGDSALDICGNSCMDSVCPPEQKGA